MKMEPIGRQQIRRQLQEFVAVCERFLIASGMSGSGGTPLCCHEWIVWGLNLAWNPAPGHLFALFPMANEVQMGEKNLVGGTV